MLHESYNPTNLFEHIGALRMEIDAVWLNSTPCYEVSSPKLPDGHANAF
jgi:hypothetical protein